MASLWFRTVIWIKNGGDSHLDEDETGDDGVAAQGVVGRHLASRQETSPPGNRLSLQRREESEVQTPLMRTALPLRTFTKTAAAFADVAGAAVKELFVRFPRYRAFLSVLLLRPGGVLR